MCKKSSNPPRRNTSPLGCASLSAAMAILLGATPITSSAGVLPATDTPHGYSLSDLAKSTAVYNTGVLSNNPSTPPAPNIPFQVLVNDATVLPDTYLYLPVYYADNTPPIDPAFPASIANQQTDAAYIDNLVKSSFNVSSFLVNIDGVNTPLNDNYIVGVTTDPLLDGTPPGTNYIVAAAVISPLTIGDHTVGFGGFINGQPAIFGSDSVTVTPEPSAVFIMTIGVAGVLTRRATRK